MVITNKIIFLRGEDKSYDFLERTISLGYPVESIIDKVRLDRLKELNPKNIISYGYRHILPEEITLEFPQIINLHNSYLPYNRGANPVFWSLYEGTPLGYSIHYINEGIDTGDILVQERGEGKIDEEGTIGEAYWNLRNSLENLFLRNFSSLLGHELKPKKQRISGTYHNSRDIHKFKSLLGDKLEKGKTLVRDIRLWKQ